MNPEEDDSNDITQKIQEIEGITPSKNYQKDGRLTLLEMHVDLDIPGYEKDLSLHRYNMQRNKRDSFY